MRRFAVLLSAYLFVVWGATGVAAPSPTTQTNQPTLITIDPSHRQQTLQGWGTSLCWWAKVAGRYPQADRQRIADQVFDPVKGLGLNVVRYNIGGGENPAEDHIAFRANMPGFEPQPGVWDWQADASQRWMLKAAIARGANRLEAFSNSPPWWMTTDRSSTGSLDGDNNLRPDFFPAFADYLATVVQHFRDTWGITFGTIEPLNEPAAWWWKRQTKQEGCHFGRAAQAHILQLLGQQLRQRGLPTRLAASDENSIDDAIRSFVALPDPVKALIAQINTHSYNGKERQQLRALAQRAGKRLWMSEYGDNDATGLRMSLQILQDMKQLQPVAWVYWQAGDGGGWGFFHTNERDERDDWHVNQKYFVMANYTRFLRPGFVMMDVPDTMVLGGVDPAGRKLVLVGTNATATQREVVFDLGNFAADGAAVEAYRTSATEQLAKLATERVARSRLHTVMKPKSVTTWVIE